MAALRMFMAVLMLGARAHSGIFVRNEDTELQLQPQPEGGFRVVLEKDNIQEVIGHIGRTFSGEATSAHTFQDQGEVVTIEVDGSTLKVQTVFDDDAGAWGIKLNWDGQGRFEDCISFGDKHWYAGPMQIDQVFPIQTATQVKAPAVTNEYDNGAINERYWLNSDGEYVIVNKETPLFVDYNNILNNSLCLIGEVTAPYSTRRNHTELTYDIWFLSDAKAAHKHAVDNYLGKPSGVPDYRMIQHPIWSTWAQYSREINETNLMEFAHQIRDYGFSDSQFELDDDWEVCYGALTVREDNVKFSNFTRLIQDIKALGYRVTIWIHPFINNNCEPWYSEALNNGYLVLTEDGSPDTSWWNNAGAVPGYIDFTNPEAAEWWYQRVKTLIDTYDIDSLKFDAGESSFSPQVPVQTGDIDLHPHHITTEYVKTCARFGDMIEVRTGFRTQNLPVFVRMVDRDSIWGLDNGLATIITTTIQMNLNGYTLVLPDMIGGNGFNLDHEQSALPSKELLIRWVQANTFLPAMQFSFGPWNFDEETVIISKKYAEIHAAFADDIYAAMQASVANGTPVNGPLWWIAPTDTKAQVIWDQYLLGENIIVAPVLEEGARSRNIYLPEGTWMEEGDPARLIVGPIELTDYPAPLDILPFFERVTKPNAATRKGVATILTVLGLLVHTVFL